MQSHRPFVIGALVLIGVPPLVSAWGFTTGSREEAVPEVPTTATSCVRDAVWMRYHHMDYLLGLRDEVVREGHRAAAGEVSGTGMMSSCEGCHSDRTRFCDRCHERVSLKIGCYDCHTADGVHGSAMR